LVSYKAQLEEFCRMTKKRGVPSYINNIRDGKYYSKVRHRVEWDDFYRQ
jgi:hypothetical protein